MLELGFTESSQIGRLSELARYASQVTLARKAPHTPVKLGALGGARETFRAVAAEDRRLSCTFVALKLCIRYRFFRAMVRASRAFEKGK